MNYKLSIGGWSSVFAVPSTVVDKHIKLAGESELKVLLFALRHSDWSIEPSFAAASVGISETAAEEAFEFWIQQGVFTHDGEKLRATPENISTAPIQTAPQIPENREPPRNSIPAIGGKMIRPDSSYIVKRMNESEDISHLLCETEITLGKTLSPGLSAVLINAHDDYCLPSEVILLIINYAKSVGKTSTSYLESLTRAWSEEGIITMASAEEKLRELGEKNIAWKKIISIAGINYRAPGKKESELSYKWVHDFGYDTEIIAESYERCVENTKKFEMKYMDKILTSWHEHGFKSLIEIRNYESGQKEQRQAGSKPQATYDINSLNNKGLFE